MDKINSNEKVWNALTMLCRHKLITHALSIPDVRVLTEGYSIFLFIIFILLSSKQITMFSC